MMRFRDINGRPAKMWIGYYDLSGHEPDGEPQIGDPLTLAGARRLAADIHRRRHRGHDVVGEHKQRKHLRRVEEANTYAACVRAYVDEHAKQLRRDDVVRRLGLHPYSLEPTVDGLVARWGDRAVQGITSQDVWNVIDEARRSAIPGIVPRTSGISEPRAGHLRSALSGMFEWLHRNRRIEQNPVVGVPTPAPPKARERVLSADEIKLLWLACNKVAEPYSTIARLLLLTGQRRDEVAGMRREELQGDL
jgi:hypothetical protein